ncbi:hypothetical protein FRB94_013122 [Tulasnella sp. JGI-2019a]|nr:hypothetical protein FRB93_001581 [Tulasnella sp. JGI-2019a]KAG9008509.1 hypothetical protein FRB94_013122 [Tulasnella sp. JGI-2019a]KAG9034833.1 hypothetical protein FRB95_012526 [Tulasnella sp. JGI-2019a]
MAEASSSPSTAAPVASSSKPLATVLALPPHISTYFVAGGVAGAASRTVVSPLERLKIIQQVQPKNTGNKAYNGVWRSLVRMWKEEGFKGLMRGNGANCIRIIPYSAVQFTTYEQLKKFFSKNGTKELDTLTRLTAGALAGITSVSTTYPLDLVRARLSILSASLDFAAASASQSISGITSSASSLAKATVATAPGRSISSASASPVLAASLSTSAASRAAMQGATSHQKVPGMLKMMTLVYKEEGGIRGLYRGLVPTAVGVAPYVGINFTAYETLRGIITPPEHKNSVPRKLACGALAGSISQTITYPLDVLRRKMQVVGMKSSSAGSLGYQYTGAWDAIFTIVRTEGVRGMYRGLWPNLLKVAPSIATSFFTYELVKEALI